MKVADIAKNRPPKILIYSDLGAGKTGLALTLGARAQILDFDDGLRTGLTIQDAFTKDRLEVDVMQFHETEPHKKATAFARAKNYIYGLGAEIQAKRFLFDAIILDSFTVFAECAVASIMANSGRIGQNPEIQHWGLAFTEIKNVMGVLRSLPVTLVVLAHQQTKTEGTGEDAVDKIEIAVQGKNLPAQIMKHFDEIWYLRAKPMGGGKFCRVLQTVNDGLRQARSRSSLENGIDTSIGLWKLIEKLGYVPPAKEKPVT